MSTSESAPASLWDKPNDTKRAEDKTELYAVFGGVGFVLVILLSLFTIAFWPNGSEVAWSSLGNNTLTALVSGGVPKTVAVEGIVAEDGTKSGLVALAKRMFPGAEINERVRVQSKLDKNRAFAQIAITEKFGDVKRVVFGWRGKTNRISMDGVVYEGGALARVRDAFMTIPEDKRGGFTVREVPMPSVDPTVLRQNIAQFLEGKVVEFDTGKDSITAKGQAVLDGIVPFVKDIKGVDIEIQGHTDNDGDRRQNLELSQRRAEAVRQYLAKRGADMARFRARGYADARPKVANDTAENKAKNRRIEFEAQEQD